MSSCTVWNYMIAVALCGKLGVVMATFTSGGADHENAVAAEETEVE